MDPSVNPFAPGAGTVPPELAGRDALMGQARIALKRIKNGLNAQSMLLVGLRGVGKTVLLGKIRSEAQSADYQCISAEAPEKRSLPALLAPELRLALLRLSSTDRAKDHAKRGLRALAGFIRAFRIKYGDLEVTADAEPEVGLADAGDLDHDLFALLEACCTAARNAGSGLLLFIDELQYVAEDQLAALIVALHRCPQHQLPLALFEAGLPQLRGQMGRAKSYAERLFSFPTVGPLDSEQARIALVTPAREEGVEFEAASLDSIWNQTQGYPYFLQEWGKHTWDLAERSPITPDDVERASRATLGSLDEGFFRVRFDRLTPAERRYLRAMADLGAGPHRSGDVAVNLKRTVQSLAPTRAHLIEKGMIWSPSHGDTAFTVPLFDHYMKRIMPGAAGREE